MPANHHIVKKKWRPPTTILGGQSGTPGAHFSRQWAHFGSVYAALYVATEDSKTAELQPSTSGYRKQQPDSQEKDTKAKKRELIQKKERVNSKERES